MVSDTQTGEVLVEKKFYKNEFDKIMADPQYKPFVDAVIDAAYTINSTDDIIEVSNETDEDEIIEGE